MKAAVVIKPNKVEILDVPEPVLRDYDVLCETLAAAICSGTDNHIVSGHPYFVKGYPLVLGHEGVGRVIKLGPKVRNYQIGDIISRVFNRLPTESGYYLRDGAFAERTIATDWQAMRDDGLPENEWSKYKVHRVLPKNFNPVEATMLITWRETYSFLKKIKSQNIINSVLIIGSGANALAFVDHGKNLGLKLTVVGSSKRAKEFYNIGVKEYFCYQDSDYLEKMKQKVFDRFDIIIDTIGESEYLNKVIHFLRPFGVLAMYGLNSYFTYTIEAPKIQHGFTFYSGEYYDEASAHDDIIEYIKNNKLNAWNYISSKHIYQLKDISKALRASKEGKVFKSVIKFINL